MGCRGDYGGGRVCGCASKPLHGMEASGKAPAWNITFKSVDIGVSIMADDGVYSAGGGGVTNHFSPALYEPTEESGGGFTFYHYLRSVSGTGKIGGKKFRPIVWCDQNLSNRALNA